jgi:hypothetical protein
LQLPRGLPRRVIDLAHTQTEGQASAFDKATALESYLRDSFTYSTHVPEVPQGRDWVDYFLFDSKQGYCDYFATAMTVLLRVEGVPARVASGFAPGDFDETSGSYIVRENHAHSWVEVYFPRYGWIIFEPSAIRPIPDRTEQAPPPPAAAQAPASDAVPTGQLTPEEQDELRALRQGAGAGAQRPFFTTWPGILVLVLLGLLAVGLLALAGLGVVWSRKLGRLAVYQRPYAQLTQLGRVFGLVRPAASDTPYEVARALGRQLPTARPTVERLTSAYVESTYANRPPAANPWPEWLATRRRLIRDLALRRLRRQSS